MRADTLFDQVKREITQNVEDFKQKGMTPGLAAIIVTDDPPDLATAKKYVSLKQSDCKELGIYSERHELHDIPVGNREKELMNLLEQLNVRDDVSGILVQMPLPTFIDKDKMFQIVDPSKDVDGLTPYNKGRLASDYDLERDLLPCTSVGVVQLLDHYNVALSGKDVVIVGRSELVGKPLRTLMEDRDATAICLNRKTKDRYRKIAEADVIVCAAGRPPELYKEDSFRLTGEMIKDGAIVVGVGGKKDPARDKMFFDVDTKSVAEKASLVTPNIGGVGLMTRGRLLKNLVTATRNLMKRVEP